MNQNAKAAVLASFSADALALGAHWVYNTSVIDKKLGRVTKYVKPLAQTYHPTKEAGEFTHYGDQTLVLLECVASASGFDLQHFAENWQAFFKDYDGYFDGATKGTLKNFTAGQSPESSGSESTDLSGASRIAPLVYRYRDDLEALLAGSRAQTAMTHNHPLVVESAEFFAGTVWHVLQGSKPTDAVARAAAEGFKQDSFSEWITRGMESARADTRETILRFGQMCETEAAFPGVIHLIAKYEDDLQGALVENVMAGGDSAARGMAVGMILGAHLGPDAIPANWLSELKQHQRIVQLLKDIDEAAKP